MLAHLTRSPFAIAVIAGIVVSQTPAIAADVPAPAATATPVAGTVLGTVFVTAQRHAGTDGNTTRQTFRLSAADHFPYGRRRP